MKSGNSFPINNQDQYRYFKGFSRRAVNPPDRIFMNPGRTQIKGDIRLGFILGSDKVFGIYKKELGRHLLVCGSSGAGKSNLLRILQVELNRLNIPYIAFDTSKFGSRFLKQYLSDLIVLRWGKDFFINPLESPPHVKIEEWLMVFSQITTEIFGLRTASKLYLLKFVQTLLIKNKDRESAAYPTLHDVCRALENRLKQKIPLNERGYINGIHSKIKTVCITLEKMINVSKGICIEKLLKYPVCIELVGIKSSEIQYWIISLIMAAITSYREAQPMSFGKLRHAFFIDEASSIVGANKSGESYVILCIRRLREYGEAIILADQCISSIKDVVKSNTYTIIGMSQTGQKDRREMVSVLGLSPDQAQAVHFLDVGQGIIRLGGRYPYPQLISFPLVKPENLSDRQLDKINSQDPRVHTLLSDVKSVHTTDQEFLSPMNSIPRYTSEKESIQKHRMFKKSEGMLMDIYNRFDVSATQRAKDLSLSASSADLIFKFIEGYQLVENFSLNLTGRRGGSCKFYSLSIPKGHDAIGKKPPKRSGGTGAKHFFLERCFQKYLPLKGFESVEIEKNINGKRVDVFGVYKSLKIGIEICCSTFRTEHQNFLKDKDGCDLVVIAAPDRKTKAKLDKELKKKIGSHDKLKTCVVHELLTHPESIITP